MRSIHITTSITNASNTAFASAVTDSSFTLVNNEFTSEYVKNNNEAKKTHIWYPSLNVKTKRPTSLV